MKNDKIVAMTHEDGQAIKRAIYILKTKKMTTSLDVKLVDALNSILEKLRTSPE